MNFNTKPFEEKMMRLTTELYVLFEESHNLETEIREKLAAIGYGEQSITGGFVEGRKVRVNDRMERIQNWRFV